MSSATRKVSPAPEKKRKRQRAALACEACRARKYRCDEQYPCKTCKKHSWDCVYKGSENFRRNQHAPSYVAELERQVRDLRVRLGLDPDTGSITLTPQQQLSPPQPSQVSATAPTGAGCVTGESAAPADPEDPEFGSEPVSLVETNSELRDINEHTNAVEFHGSTSSIAFLALARRQHTLPGGDGAIGDGASFELPINQSSLVSTLQNAAFSPIPARLGGSRGSLRGEERRRHPRQPPDQHHHSAAGSGSDAGYDNDIDGDYDAHADDMVGAQKASKAARYYFRQAQGFIEVFFENLHVIHPILNRGEFMARCEDLWAQRTQSESFIALYYAVLALGVSTRPWSATEPTLDGLTRRQWVHHFFDLSQASLGQVRSAPNDLESVQALIFLAKVCQNGLNSHMAYMLLGVAVRASLAAGYHREPRPVAEQAGGESQSDGTTTDPGAATTSAAIWRTWWGLYSFETEVAFSLGRPHGLGGDEHHNRRVLPVSGGQTDVIACMVPFARITHQVALSMCTSGPHTTLRERLARAMEISKQTEAWREELPARLRPQRDDKPEWAGAQDRRWHRQKIGLHLRYCNIRMVLFRPFLVHALAARRQRAAPPPLLDAVHACIEAAQRTIDAIHGTFVHHRFFRSWFYNTTYVLYAGAIMLCCAARFRPRPSPEPEHTALEPLASRRAEFVRYVDMTIDVLEVMRESSVAREAAGLLRQSLTLACDRPAAPQPCAPPPDLHWHPLNPGPVPLPHGLAPPFGPPKQDFSLPCIASDPSFSDVLDEPMPCLPMNQLFGAYDSYGAGLLDEAAGFGPAVAGAGAWPDFGAYGAGGAL